MCSAEMVSLGVRILRGSLLVVGVVAAQNATLTVTSPTSEDKIAIGEDFVVEFETEGDVSGPYLVDLFKAGGQMWNFCDTEGCETEDNSIPLTISQETLATSNYTIRVKDTGDSGAEGYSDLFEILETTDSGVAVEQSDVTGADIVAGMDNRMFVFAMICGTAVFVAIIVGIYFIWRRRSQKSQTARALAASGLRGDVEMGGGGGGGGGDRLRNGTRITPAVEQIVSTSRRSMEKVGRSRSSSSAHPFSSETSAYMSSSETRGRSRTPSRVREDGSLDRDSGRRMISRTPTRSWQGQEDDGPRMYPTTPQDRSDTRSGPRMYTPQRDGMDPPGSRASRGSSGPRIFSSSPGLSARSAQDDISISTFSSAPGANWEEPMGSRRMYSSTPSGSAQYEERARIISRSLSTGRDRTPYGYHRDDIYGDDTTPPVPRPHRRSSSRSPSAVHPRSRSMDRHSRRSRMSQTLEQWQRDVERKREARGLRTRSPERWIKGELTSMPRSKSAHVLARRDRGDRPYSGAPAYEEYRRALDDDPQQHGANVETRAPLGSPTRNRGYRSGLADFASSKDEGDSSRYQEVSWEEMRHKYIQQQDQQQTKVKRDHAHFSQTGFDPDDSQGGMEAPQLEADSRALTKIYPASGPAQPVLSDASSVGTLSVHSSGSHVHAPPPGTYRVPPQVSDPSAATTAPRDILGGEGGALIGSGGLSSSSDTKLAIHSQSGGSTGARALSARAAAREAQLSAERALAAAAAASRAADAAAQAATEAEAEADAERGAVVVKNRKSAPASGSALSSVGQSSVSSPTWSSTTASTKAVAGGSKWTRRGLAAPRVGRPSSFSFMRSAVGATGSDRVDQGRDVNHNGKRAQPKKVEIEVKVKAKAKAKAKTKTKTKPEISVEPSKAPVIVESEREDELEGTDETLSKFSNVRGDRERSGSQGSEVRGGDTAGGASEAETLPRSSMTPATLWLPKVDGGGSYLNSPFRRHSFDAAVSERTTTEHLPNAGASPAARTSSPVLPVTQNEPYDFKLQCGHEESPEDK